LLTPAPSGNPPADEERRGYPLERRLQMRRFDAAGRTNRSAAEAFDAVMNAAPAANVNRLSLDIDASS
jgi:hypothetical protein